MNGNQKIHKIVAQAFIDQIEAGMADGKWTAPWAKFATDFSTNAVTKKTYRGFNIFSLWSAGFSSPYWATFKQWKSIDATVKKGSKGSLVVFWKIIDSKTRFDANGNPEKVPFLRFSNVFNADQVDGWTAPTLEDRPTLSTNEIHAECDAMIAATGAEIQHGGNKACYIPSHDRILLPEFNAFHDADSYYQTAFHELAHWTGHASRLDRNLSTRFGSNAYALEELLAELTAAIVGVRMGIDVTTRMDHAKYVKSWLTALREQPECLMHIASKASKVADYLIEGEAGETEQYQAQAA